MKILFFSPHAHVSVHSIPELIVAESLSYKGHDVTVMLCDGAFSSYCISMSAAGLWPDSDEADKKKICDSCKRTRDIIKREYDFSYLYVDDYLNKEDIEEIQCIVKNIDKANYLKLSVFGVDVARYALFEFMLNYKLNRLDLSDEEWSKYEPHLLSALMSVYAANKYIKTLNPDVLVSYNAIYSVNHVASAIAEQEDIPYFTLHAGSNIYNRYSRMTIFKGLMNPYLINRTQLWSNVKEKPLSFDEYKVVERHIDELLCATDPWVYSIASRSMKSDDLRGKFGIKKSQKVMLLTMSSADERFAISTVGALPPYVDPMFPTQLNWIKNVIDYVKNNNNLFLLIRVHPREFPNKREKVLSEQAMLLLGEFNDLPDNACVNWPKDNISLHDLVKIADVGLNATSTSGLELGMFGIPVVLYDEKQLFSYAPEINYVAKDIDDYFNKIQIALDKGLSVINSIMVFRWLSYRLNYIDIDIEDGYKTDARRPGFFYRLYMYILRRVFGEWREYQIEKKIKNRKYPVKNYEKLSRAIENNLSSHAESYDFEDFPDAKIDQENKLIYDWLLVNYKKISVNKDEFDELIGRLG